MRLLQALLYREITILKKRFPEIITLWIFSILFGLFVIYGPSVLLNTSVEHVVDRLSMLFGKKLSLEDALTLMFTLSAVISMTTMTMSDFAQQIVDDKFSGAIDHVLLSTTLVRYYISYAIALSIVTTPVATIYLVPLLYLVKGLGGVLIYAYLLPVFLLSCILLSLYASSIIVPLAYLTKIQRLWILPSIIVPMLLAGSGVFIPLTIVPLFLKLLAYTSPLPETCTILQDMLLRAAGKLALPLTLLTMLMVLYVLLYSGTAKIVEARARTQGAALT